MKAFRWSLLVLIGLFASVGLYVYFYTGAYKDINIQLIHHKGFHSVYVSHMGPYHQIESALQSVEKWAERESIPCVKTFGIFLDDPKKVDSERLRSEVGCIVGKEIQKLPNNFSYKFVKPEKSLMTLFTGAPSIAPFKVYPKLFDYIKENNLKAKQHSIEIYQLTSANGIETTYLIPLVSNLKFKE